MMSICVNHPAVAFTVTLYLFLMIFFWCVSAFEKMPRVSKNRERLKILVCMRAGYNTQLDAWIPGLDNGSIWCGIGIVGVGIGWHH